MKIYRKVKSAFGGLWVMVSVGLGAAELNLDVASLSLDELMEVEVTTPGKVPEAIRDTPASIYLMTREDIETFGYSDLTEVLENVPGFFNIDNYTGASGNLGVRGFWNGRSQNSSVAILVNGVPQMRPDLFASPMENINVPVEAIDRIEVSRGPNGVIYGNGAFFGAINIITDGSYSDDLFTVSAGDNGNRKVAGRFSEFGDDYHVIVNAGYSESDGYQHDLLDLVGPVRAMLLPAFGVNDENSLLAGKLEQESRFLQLSAAWKQLYFDYSLNDATVESFSGYPSVVDGNSRESESSRITFGANVPLGDYALNTKLTYVSFYSEENYDALYPDFFGINTRDFNTWELESLFTYDKGDRLRFLGGLNLQRLQNFHEYTHVPDVGLLHESVVTDERDIRSLFAQVDYELSEVLSLVAGYRIEEVSEYDRFVFVNEPIDGTPLPGPPQGGFDNGTPRLSLIYHPDDWQVLKFMVGDANKIPSFNGPEFKAEKTRTVEFNYTWSKESIMVSASLFRNSLNNLLIQTLDTDDAGGIDTDLVPGGEVDTDGVEFLVRKSFTDSIRGEVGVTWQNSESAQTPDGELSYSPEWVVHGKLSYQKGDFSAAALGRFVDEMNSFYNLDATANPLVANRYFGDPSESYFVADLNFRWDDIWDNVFLNLRVTNVFDTEIRYPNNPINGLLLDRGHLGHERRFILKAGVRF